MEFDSRRRFFGDRNGRDTAVSTLDRVKTGFDECRMLALGAQVLIGFQFQGVFQPGFAGLPNSFKIAQIAGLLLLLTSLAALIIPSTQHMLAERMWASRRIESILTRCLDISLPPLAAALALDVAIALRTTADDVLAFALAIIVFLTAAGLWFG